MRTCSTHSENGAGARRRPPHSLRALSGGLGRGIVPSVILHFAVFGILVVSGTNAGRVSGPVVIDLTMGSPAEATFASRTDGPPVPPSEPAAASPAARAGPPPPPAAPSPAETKPLPEPVSPPPEATELPLPDAPPAGPPVDRSLPVAEHRAPSAAGNGGASPATAVDASAGQPRGRMSALPGTGAFRAGGEPSGEGAPSEVESTSGARGRYLARHFEYIRETIQRRITYPVMARRMGWEGRVVVAFTVRMDGTAANARLVSGSGHSLLDRSALEAVRASSPFPCPPVEAEIVTPIVYSLGD